jgi:dephospho-CoA kinase
MASLANERRAEFGSNYWALRLLDGYSPGKRLVLTSIRNPAEVEELKARGGALVEVFAGQKTRYVRTVDRVRENPKEHGDVKSFAEFKEKEARELSSPDPSKQQLAKCISLAEHRLDNNGSVERLGEEIEAVLKALEKKKK